MGTEAKTQARALTGGQTGEVLAYGAMPGPLSRTGQGFLRRLCGQRG